MVAQDSLDTVKADLETLPPLRAKYLALYLHGEDESPGATLAVVREMRRAGWGMDVARSMMSRWPAEGTRWLLDQEEPDAEFDRCWELAAVSVSRLHKSKKVGRSKPFVSPASDQVRVLAFVEANPGLGVRALQRSRCGLECWNYKGRIEAALKVLTSDGRIRTEPGPRNARLHYVMDGRGSDSEAPAVGTSPPSSIGGKRYGTVRGTRGRKAKVWKQYQGLTVIQWKAWVLLRRIADLSDEGSSCALFATLRDEGIVKPTVLWKYLRALEESGLLALAEEDIYGKVLWTARAASPEAVAATLGVETLPEGDRRLWEGLQRLYDAHRAAAEVSRHFSLDDILNAPGEAAKLTIEEIRRWSSKQN